MQLNTFTLNGARPKLLDIRMRPMRFDPLVERALEKTKEKFLYELAEDPADELRARDKEGGGDGKPFDQSSEEEEGPFWMKMGLSRGLAGVLDARPTTTERLLRFIREAGISSQIARLTATLNKASLDDLKKALLATEGVYESILFEALTRGKVRPSDLEGLRYAVLVNLEAEPKRFFLESLADAFIASNRLRLSDPARDRLIAMMANGLPLIAGRTNPHLRRLVDTISKEGDLRDFVRAYAIKGEIPARKFTPAVETAMVKYLLEFDLELDQDKFEAGEYDEYFALAYRNAVETTTAAEDPLDLKDRKKQVQDWDFMVNTFETGEEQGIVKEYIYAASVLYYCYILSDKLNVLQLANALLLRRARGKLELSRPVAAKFYGYRQRSRDRMPREELSHFFRRAFNLGDSHILDGTLVNEDFPQMWDALMEEVTEYIRKSEVNSSDLEDKVSRAGIDEAVRNLQYNLSAHMGDMEIEVQELYSQIEDAMNLMDEPEVFAGVGLGRRQDVWTLMERIAAEDFETDLNVNNYRTMAVRGWMILRYVATFDSTTPEEDFRNFVRSCEKWIIARAGVKDEMGPGDEAEEDEEDGEDSTEIDEDDWES
jgi:hypothetical protein